MAPSNAVTAAGNHRTARMIAIVPAEAPKDLMNAAAYSKLLAESDH